MIKSFLRVLLSVLMLSGLASSLVDAGTIEIAFNDRNSRQTLVTLNERRVEFLHLEHIAAVFEIEMEVDPGNGRVTLRSQDKSVSFSPGQGAVIANRQTHFLETPPLKIEEKIMVPLEFLTTILPLVYDRDLHWDAGQRTLSVGIRNLEILGLSFSPYGNYTRVIVELNKAPAYTVSEKLPSLLIFNLPHAKIILQEASQEINSRSVKHAKVIDTFGTSQLILRLGKDFERYTHRLLEEPPRLVLDVYNTQESIVEAPLPGPDDDDILEQDIGAPAGQEQGQEQAEPSPAFSLQTVVIDPGHGGSDSGIVVAPATGDIPELQEKQLTLHVAGMLGTALTQRLGVRSVFTRETDEFVSSESRTTIANSNRADIFLSIHVNNSQFPAESGFETYVMDYGSLDLPEEISARTQLLDYAQARHIERSSRLAQQIVAAYVARNKGGRAGVKHAPLFTLKGATMPSIHIEIGYGSNGQDRARLLQEDFQQVIVAAIVDGIAAFKREEEHE